MSQPPDLIVYTDVDRNLRFDPAVDKREVLLTGFQGKNHDHSLHSVTVGPDGKWMFNSGNTGGMFTDKSGKTFRVFGAYRDGPVGPFKNPHNPAEWAGKPSDDGHIYVGGFTVRMNPDGTNAEIIGHNYRNSYEQSISSFGDVFQNDNDDPPACRVSWVMEYANFGFSSNDGQRSWQADRRPGQSTPVAEWRQDDPGMTPFGDVYGGGSPTGNVFYENGALGAAWEGTFLAAEAGRNEVFSYQPKPSGRGLRARSEDLRHLEREAEVRRVGLPRRRRQRHQRGRDAVPAVRRRGRPRRRDLRHRLDRRARRRPPGSRRRRRPAPSTASRRRASCRRRRRSTPTTIEGQITALRSPAVNVRAIGFDGLKARGAAAVGPVAALLNDPSRFIRARALYLLYQLGPEGQKRAGSPESQTDPAMRIAAYRAMRRAGLDVLPVAAKLAKDTDPGVRREVALSLRDEPAEKSLDLLVELARGYDGQDRTYLEALGTGATKKEAALYDRLRAEPGAKSDPLAWDATFARLAWRLHVPAAVPDLLARARVVEAVRGRSQAGDGHAGVHRRSGGVEGDADARRAGQRAEGAGHVVAAEPDVEQLDGAQPAAGAEDGRHLRSRRDRAARGDRPAAGGEPAGAVGRARSSTLKGDAGARQGHGHAVRDVPHDRRRRRRARPGARRLGTRQVGRRDRHGDRQPERRDRARLRRHGSCAPTKA